MSWVSVQDEAHSNDADTQEDVDDSNCYGGYIQQSLAR